MYRDHRKGPGGPPGGGTYPEGPHGLKWEGNQPLVGWCTPPWAPLRLGLETLGGRSTCLGGQVFPLGRRPPEEIPSPRASAPLGSLYKEGGGRAAAPNTWRLPTPLATPPPPVVAWRSPAGSLLQPPPRRRAAGSSSTSPSPLLDQEGEDVSLTVHVLNAEVPSVRR